MSLHPQLDVARQALDQALLLARSPGLVRRFRSAPLPDGVLQVLRIAAGDESSIGEAVAATERSVKSLQEAATFYIVQVLLSPGHDSYRTLGAHPGAGRDELRTHMVWLLKWLHPDTHKGEPHTVFATRVTTAWETLRTPESRELYDTAQRRPPPGIVRRPHRRRPVDATFGVKARRPHPGSLRSWRRWAVPVLLGSLVASCVALAAIYLGSLLEGMSVPEGGIFTQIEAGSGVRH